MTLPQKELDLFKPSQPKRHLKKLQNNFINKKGNYSSNYDSLEPSSKQQKKSKSFISTTTSRINQHQLIEEIKKKRKVSNSREMEGRLPMRKEIAQSFNDNELY